MNELAIESLHRVGHLRVRVSGSSMLPCIRPGDILEVRSATRVTPGSVVLFSRGGRFFAHRVARCEGERVITRGDSLHHEDGAVGAGELLGEVVEVERNGRALMPRATLATRAAAFVFQRSPLAGRLFTRLWIA